MAAQCRCRSRGAERIDTEEDCLSACDTQGKVDELSPVSQLLKKARRRSLVDLVLDQSALAISIAMGGAIVLMLTGTSLLEWYWIAVLAVASLAVGLYRVRGRIPSEYRMAQRIDWKMSLADALSTATYFANEDKPICAEQRRAAEEVARTIDARVAVPFTRSRFAWPAAGLALVACGLFAVRYAVTGTMSLEPSLVKMAYDTFFGNGPAQQQAKNNIRKNAIDPNSPLDPGNPDAPTTQNDQVPDSELQTVETPDVNNSSAADQSKEAAKGEKSSPEDTQGDNGEKGEKGDQSANQDDQGNQDKKDGTKSEKSKEGKQDPKNQNANNENSSMLDKLKDAMANMMNKMKSTPPKEAQSAQNSQDSKAGAQEKGQKSSQNQKGSQSDSQDADAQSDQQQGDKSEQKQSANAKSGDKSQDKNNSPDAKSGIGSSDGDKAAKEAEQLAAMGKISEILGKRAANVTGEVMVEVGSTKQQLKTPWAQKQATHVEAGSEIHRDEVPLMYQQFVQQYFEEIRKGTDAGGKAGSGKAGDGKSTVKTPSP
jgi:hypothetical protein